jgi:hypothetical protein
VFVNGHIVVAAGKVIGIDESELLEQARTRAEAIRSQLGVSAHNEWPVS